MFIIMCRGFFVHGFLGFFVYWFFYSFFKSTVAFVCRKFTQPVKNGQYLSALTFTTIGVSSPTVLRARSGVSGDIMMPSLSPPLPQILLPFSNLNLH
ncbi:hypothetical protein L6452_33403 [Arctium lappa]|uniref:Uncharacterized protein n=1 Tax=Arctium lappa TaxID=4217 RepID=A0ACB8YG84_ARCLA|nr:hypothetical protein L6452_33403 [Arctium lappa]